MPAIYDRSPLRIKLPEDNGGNITNVDMFPGSCYFTSASDLIDANNYYSSVLTSKFNVYGTFRAPNIIRYIPSLNSFSSVFYKGIYIYNPSIEKDNVDYECSRRNIFFSINGGSVFSLPSVEKVFYESEKYSSFLNDKINLSKVDRTSSNNNVRISMSVEEDKNKPLPYFNVDGSYSGRKNILSLSYTNASSGIVINELMPGDYVGIYLRIESFFSPNSIPIDYSFFNLRYENSLTSPRSFGDRDNIPGVSVSDFSSYRFYTQSMAAKFETRLDFLNRDINSMVDIIYDNYPPFFADYRDYDINGN